MAALGVALSSTRYLWGDSALIPTPLRASLLENGIVFLLHVLGGLVALAVGPWQFLPGLRRRRPHLHRTLGGLYVIAVLVGAVGALIVAPDSFAGPVASVGFVALALLWLLFTALGLHAIARGAPACHRRWMIRSYALAFAAVTLRVQLPAADLFALPFEQVYRFATWSSWIVSLAGAEFWIRQQRATTAQEPA